MTRPNPYRFAAMALFATAVLVALVPVWGGAVGYFVVAAVIGVIALGLLRGMRRVGYVAFVVAGITGGVALGALFAIGGLPAWWAIATTVCAWAAAVSIFAPLWRSAEVAQTEV